jgi:transposase-like protein
MPKQSPVRRRRAPNSKDAETKMGNTSLRIGAWREETAKIGGMDRQTLRDWVIRFNDQGPSREFFSKLYGETGAVTIGAEPVITAVAVGTPFRRFLSVYTLIALLIGSLRVLLMVLR